MSSLCELRSERSRWSRPLCPEADATPTGTPEQRDRTRSQPLRVGPLPPECSLRYQSRGSITHRCYLVAVTETNYSSVPKFTAALLALLMVTDCFDGL